MQTSDIFSLDIHKNISEMDMKNLYFPLQAGDRIFFSGDLGAGKSTFIRGLIRTHLTDPDIIVRSPTYTYYQRYGSNIYHFDLYRVESFEDIFLIGAQDILDDPTSICLIEWPEILGESVTPTRKISLTKEGDDHREIRIMTASTSSS